MQKKVGVISLGCDKNRVDTENVLAALERAGYQTVQMPEEAEILIVNTCAFLESARAEAIDTVLEMAAYKQTGALQKLVVCGCLGQGYESELMEGIPEIDAVLGVNASLSIVETLQKLYDGERVSFVPSAECERFAEGRVLTTPLHYAYLKIADGCNNFCSYCRIPALRGRYRSKPLERLVKEATALAESGVGELILVAQDVTRYGKDLGGKLLLPTLLQALKQIDGIAWLRLLYCYPELVTDELIACFANGLVVPYIDVPLQHINDRILKAMRRRSCKAEIIALIEKLRKASPDIAIRSTFIVGFPGETEAEFCELLDFLKEYQLTHAGFFAYSREEGTPAYDLPDQIPEEVKAERLARAQAVQAEIMANEVDGLVGSVVDLVADGIDYDRQCFYGRTQRIAPEADNPVLFTSEFPVTEGNRYQVKITGREGLSPIGSTVEGENHEFTK